MNNLSAGLISGIVTGVLYALIFWLCGVNVFTVLLSPIAAVFWYVLADILTGANVDGPY